MGRTINPRRIQFIKRGIVMREQKFAFIDNDELKQLNNEGWYVKQVIERTHDSMLCIPTRYYVLLEKLVHDE